MNDVAAYLTFDEACEILRVSKNVLRPLLKSKQIPARKVGREWRIPRESITAYMDAENAKLRVEARALLG